MNIRRDIRFRVYIAFTAICLFGAAIIVKAFVMQAKDGKRLRSLAIDMHTEARELPAVRGDIYTESNELLCTSLPVFDIHVDFSVIDTTLFREHVGELAHKLADLFKDDEDGKKYYSYLAELRREYKDGNQYWLLKKKASYSQYMALRSFPIFNKGQYRGGIIAKAKTDRINPYENLAFRTIGLYREGSFKEQVRNVGLEAACDSLLQGKPGHSVVQKTAGGKWVPVQDSVVAPRNGKDIVTTLDPDIQGIAEYAVLDLCKKYNLVYGTCVVMEVETGKVRALVNLGKVGEGKYAENMNYAMRAIEPGSVFKLATLTALLNDKHINISDIVDVEGGVKSFGRRTMKDSHLGDHKMTIKDAFAHSSNVAHAKLAYTYYQQNPERFIAQLEKMHLHEKAGLEIPGEYNPVIKDPESDDWSKTTIPWMATGYAVQITPLQTCMLYNAVANNGKMMRPYLVSEVREKGQVIYKKEPEVVEEAIADEAAIKQLKACLEEVALTGTAKNVQSPFYTVAGKTGTAQFWGRDDEGNMVTYKDRSYHGSFVGYFPADNPKYTVAVVMRTQKHGYPYYGGVIAAPVFKMIADRVFAAGKGWDLPVDSVEMSVPLVAQKATGVRYSKLLNAIGVNANIQVDGRMQHIKADSNKKLIAGVHHVYKGQVPDVSGMGLKDAVYLLEREGLLIHIKGKGKVRAQSIAPGTLVQNGAEITLDLRL